MKTGLVLEGGSMRGMFTCGVLDTMMNNNLEVDGAVGVSAGAIFGCNMKSRQMGRAIRYNMNYCNDKRYGSLESRIKTGSYFSNEFCYKTLPNELDIFDVETYQNNKMEFYAVATDAKTGKAVYKRLDNGDESDIQWLRASGAMPGMSEVVKIDGYELLDGGIADSVPIQYFESIGYDRIIVILTQPKGYVKEKNKYIPILKLFLRNYPLAVETLSKRHFEYNDTIKYIEEKEKRGEILVIRPNEPLNIASVVHEPEELKRVYDIGIKTANEHLNEIKAFLNQEVKK